MADSIENALCNCIKVYNWHVCDITVLEDIQLFSSKNEYEQKKIIFELIKEGLYDVAKIDNLDKDILEKVFDKAENKYLKKDYNIFKEI